MGFKQTEQELYRELEKEYYLQFNDKYVEGLHPVRSEHLVSILHSHIPVSESLIALLAVVDEDYIYDFFITAPVLFDLDADNDFYKAAAKAIAQKSIAEMVYAIDGLMHLEPYRYWKTNKSVFDEIFNTGGSELFVFDIPFSIARHIKKSCRKRRHGKKCKYSLPFNP
ncbi:MAG: hypothetical protein IPP79_14430 [Chitinophagaceae bacterium]|nr:hypothetical protein [Chitinophagaceae bacterium]